MENQLFRAKSLERISSPEQLNDYLRVTNPAVWLVLTAVILMLAGVLIWSSSANIDSIAYGDALVDDGAMRIVFDEETIAKNVKPGMTVSVGDTETKITSIGADDDGRLFATAETTLSDGYYRAGVIFRKTQIIKLLFN